MFFPNAIPSLAANASTTDRRVQVAYARAWEALVETHRAGAANFVEALAPPALVQKLYPDSKSPFFWMFGPMWEKTLLVT